MSKNMTAKLNLKNQEETKRHNNIFGLYMRLIY